MPDEPLIALARLNGIETTLPDRNGKPQTVSARTLRNVLSALGVAAANNGEIAQSIADHELARWREVLPPVLVRRASALPVTLEVRLPATLDAKRLHWRVTDENGAQEDGFFRPRELTSLATHAADGTAFVLRPLMLPVNPEPGYHRIEIYDGDEVLARTSFIICPDAAYQPEAIAGSRRVWGPAVQLATVRSSHNWGAGDFTDLRMLIGQWAARGAGLVGVDGLHLALPGHGPGTNAYRAASRLHVDVRYLDIERIEDLRECEEAQALIRSADFQSRLTRLRAADQVDADSVAELKRMVLGLLHRSFRSRHLYHGTARAGAFRAYRRAQGESLRRHALFAALQEHFQREHPSMRGWPEWPEDFRDAGSAAVARFAEQYRERLEFLEYVRWQVDLQWHAAGWRCEEVGLGVGLIGSLPLSATRDGAETWSEPGSYAFGASIGAPPDAANGSGRDDALAPLHPHRLRHAAYRPFIAALRANMRDNGAICLQQAAGLARLFWIPARGNPAQGAYVNYPLGELLGILALESQRNRCLVIAEDIETLPEAARRAYADNGLLTRRLLQMERDKEGDFAPPAAYPPQSLVVASSRTGPTLAEFWEGRDLDAAAAADTPAAHERRQAAIVNRSQDRARLLLALEREGLLPPGVTPNPLSLPAMTDAFAQALQLYLARSPACLLMVRLEDVVRAAEPAADAPAPGRGKLALTLEDWPEDPRFVALTDALAQARGQALFPYARTGADDRVRAIIPRATYRLQLHRDFGFRQAAQLVPYLARLGVSHVYCSPYLKARPGSHHGYDIIDHNALNPEIGSREDFDAFVDALKSSAMGHILDMVPNHMGVMGGDNAWWLDVLENGHASHYAEFFDIDWDPASAALKGKVLVPVLGDHYGALLERGEIRLAYEAATGSFSVYYYEHRFPVDPCQYPVVLERAMKAALGESVPSAVLDEFASLVTAFRNLPGRDEIEAERRSERNRDKEVHKRRLARVVTDCAPLARAIDAAVRGINGSTDNPASFDTLHALLEAQAYRLAYWRVASDEINYRRFFDINDLAALRMEDEVVFDATHHLVLDLVAAGQIEGLRIDHPDGLYDPAAYFRHLQDRISLAWGVNAAEPASRQSLPLYVVLEKITAGYERLPEAWRVHGTTGYRFMNVVNGLFVDGAARAKLDRIYEAFVPEALGFEEIAYQSRRVILRTALASELTVLSNRLARLAQSDRRTRDFTLNTLRQALVEVVACFPVYRTYIVDKPSADDRRYLDWAVSRARRRSRAADATIFDFVRAAALGQSLGGEQTVEALAFAHKFQQFTAPVTAKGVEDTSFYRYHRLVSLNEVGGDPGCFGFTVSAFHGASQDRAQRWPHTMLATSTHDCKRSEDVRVRIDVISELPAAWRLGLRRWSRLNRSRKRVVEGRSAPSRNDEYLLYQTLLGTWPLEALTEDGLAALRERIQTYMTKAVREAKVESSWINVNTAYEAALAGFIDALLAKTEGNLFLQDFLPLQRSVAWLGMLNSLSQTLIKLTSPGVPDIYQGNELWDLSLVDPDNRRPVDYEQRSLLLAEMQEQLAAASVGAATQLDAIMRNWESGGPKLYLIWRALELRREYPQLFAQGDYTPLVATGERADNVVAYARRLGDSVAIVVAGRLFSRLVTEPGELPLRSETWGDTAVPADILPVGSRPLNVLTGRSVEVLDGRLLVADIFADFPGALLFCESTTE
ncbi:MAG TPA: malto-oligosyltrehalose synthase [Burkholderiales bacterium]|nr:malto-oligosyltrehalose synthase [Burkholderiales bacterium]